jgi:adenine-specific DNA methylase
MISSYKLEEATVTPRTKDGYGNYTNGTPYTHRFFIERKLIYEKGGDNINFLKGKAILQTSDDITISDLDLINFDSTNFRIVEIFRPRSWGYKKLSIMVV